MFIVKSYALAVVLCVITMICWGSWGNTQKLAAKSWRYELYYWDYVIGILLFSILSGFTLGSFGSEGRAFLPDLMQISGAAFISAIIGGVIFNASNILLSASVSLSGMSVAFPVGVGLALVLGTIINYFGQPVGDPLLLFLGVGLVAVAIIVNGFASRGSASGGSAKKRGIWLAIAAGVLMSLFYRFVAMSMDLDNFQQPAPGKATPYTAFFIFAIGIFLSNYLFNTIAMRRPVDGSAPVKYSQYFSGSAKTHLVGILGGAIWGLGTIFSYIAAGKAGASISYSLGQGAPMIAALWGLIIWHEFKGANRTTYWLIAIMFLFYIGGLACVTAAGA